MKVMVAHGDKRRGAGVALHNNTCLQLVRGSRQRNIKGRGGRGGSLSLKTATGDNHDLGGHVIDPAS